MYHAKVDQCFRTWQRTSMPDVTTEADVATAPGARPAAATIAGQRGTAASSRTTPRTGHAGPRRRTSAGPAGLALSQGTGAIKEQSWLQPFCTRAATPAATRPGHRNRYMTNTLRLRKRPRL